MFTDISILEKLQIFPREFYLILPEKFYTENSKRLQALIHKGYRGRENLKKKEIAEGGREMNFRKIFFRETTGEAEGEKQGREIGGLQNRCSVGISLTVYPCKKGVKKDPTFNENRKRGVAPNNI